MDATKLYAITFGLYNLVSFFFFILSIFVFVNAIMRLFVKSSEFLFFKINIKFGSRIVVCECKM